MKEFWRGRLRATQLADMQYAEIRQKCSKNQLI